MIAENVRSYPRSVVLQDGEVELRFMAAGDAAPVATFARELPAHDLLFLPRDITQPKVLAAWINELERGELTTVLAAKSGRVVGCATIARDPLSWSPHVAELRVVVLPAVRGNGLGRLLSQEAFAVAVGLGIEKMIAQMTTDQRGAIAVFETMGYRGEALLRDHVRDRDGVKHDLVILSHDVAKYQQTMNAYGLGEVARD